ncbi:uncharacterized protein LOC130711061 isoform X2 [Lotus japonicus]|uniref:uncharacterized protein LOC130711061 isoform X2 n=1 Tax=Lotus japonicus TaxID=34305 RepID=UPI0025846598|nr:uncharacterized protein LOC130711061 isoform X2 [Lotus japonicus]XP_057416498.1 uncharacterized protein LOC130711061 isoform X2 [Lotus japonicus]XP_057416499.1 uncharacterized protein LOC130711061 isoform X2 [Lotus japonicus]
MIWSKDPALGPCSKKISHHVHQHQMHKVHTLMNSCVVCPQRKRKLDQYMNNGKYITTFELCTKKYGKQNAINQSRSQNSSPAPLPVSKGKSAILEETQELAAFPTLNDRIEHCIVSQEIHPHLSDSNDSYKGLYLEKKRNLKIRHKDLMSSSSCTHSFKTSLKSLVVEEFVDPIKISQSISSKREDKELNPPLKNFLAFKGNHLLRPIIPIGPRFQVEVPNWDVTRNSPNSDEDWKWLGTQIPEINTKVIGKRRMKFKGGK